MMKSTASVVDLDSVLDELGHFGKYQVITYCYLLVPILFSAIYNAQYIFTAPEIRYRCAVPECESLPSSLEPGSWGAWALPENGGECSRLKPVGTGCDVSDFLPNTSVSCSSWIYENYQESIVSEYDLACETWKRTLVGTIHSVGLFAALPLVGYVSDRHGRKTALILAAVAAGVMGIVRSFSMNYEMYLVMEFLDATLGSGVYSTGFILTLELVGPTKRVMGGNIISICYAFGEVLLALAAWVLPDWQKLTWLLYAPSLLFVMYYFFIEESVRWLLSTGNKESAARIIFKAAETNKKKLSTETMKQLTKGPEVNVKPVLSEKKVEDNTENSLFREVIQSRILMVRVAVCSFWWITVTFIYYGLSINSVSLAGNKYVNYILSALVEIPGYCISVLTLDRFGRKSSIISAFFICGISLIILPFIPESLSWLATSLSLVGKLAISMVFSSIYIYTSELFPTSARHRLLGTCSMFGRVGNIVAPQTPLLIALMDSLPYLLFGALAGISGLLMLLTPETLRAKLPDTVQQAEDIAVKPENATISP